MRGETVGRALAGLVAVVVVAGCSDPSPGDPGVTTQDLWESADEGDWLEPISAGQVVVIEPGERVTDSLARVTLVREGELTLLDVRSNGGGPSLKPLGFRIAPPERRLMDRLQYPVFPPTEDALGTPPLEGDEITIPYGETRSDKSYQLLRGYRFVADELAVRESFDLLYEVDGDVYRQTMPTMLAACPQRMTQDRCTDPMSDAMEQDWRDQLPDADD